MMSDSTWLAVLHLKTCVMLFPLHALNHSLPHLYASPSSSSRSLQYFHGKHNVTNCHCSIFRVAFPYCSPPPSRFPSLFLATSRVVAYSQRTLLVTDSLKGLCWCFLSTILPHLLYAFPGLSSSPHLLQYFHGKQVTDWQTLLHLNVFAFSLPSLAILSLTTTPSYPPLPLLHVWQHIHGQHVTDWLCFSWRLILTFSLVLNFPHHYYPLRFLFLPHT